MKIVRHQCTKKGVALTLWKVEWLLGKTKRTQTIWFFTEQEAKAALAAVTVHCVSHGIDPSHLPQTAIAVMIDVLRQGKDAILFVSPTQVGVRNNQTRTITPKGSVH